MLCLGGNLRKEQQHQGLTEINDEEQVVQCEGQKGGQAVCIRYEIKNNF